MVEHLAWPLTRPESDAFVKRIEREFDERGYGLWAVEEPGVVEFAGFVGLHHHDFPAHFTPCVEVGWRLATPFWGRGYATEGGRAALRFAFTELELTEVVSMTTVGNTRSRAVMERLGMTRDPGDVFDHPNVPPDNPSRRHVLYRISASTFLRADPSR